MGHNPRRNKMPLQSWIFKVGLRCILGAVAPCESQGVITELFKLGKILMEKLTKKMESQNLFKLTSYSDNWSPICDFWCDLFIFSIYFCRFSFSIYLLIASSPSFLFFQSKMIKCLHINSIQSFVCFMSMFNKWCYYYRVK